jgi:hypothetical protein
MAVRAELHDRPTAKGFGGNGDGSPWTGLLEVAQAFYRWQNTYSPAGTLEQEFFACPVPELGTLPLRRIVVPSGPGTWGTALDDARLGYVSPSGDKLMARVSLSVHPTGSGEVACLFLIGPTGRAAFLQTLVEGLETWMAAHPHLCGAKLDAKGDFLKFDRPYTWDDIVLAPSVRAAVETHLCKFVARVGRYQELGGAHEAGHSPRRPPGDREDPPWEDPVRELAGDLPLGEPGAGLRPRPAPVALRTCPRAPADGPVPGGSRPLRQPARRRGRPPRGTPEPA